MARVLALALAALLIASAAKPGEVRARRRSGNPRRGLSNLRR